MIHRAWLFTLALAGVTFLGGVTAEASPRAQLSAKRASPARTAPLQAREVRAAAPKKASSQAKGRKLSAEPKRANAARFKRR